MLCSGGHFEIVQYARGKKSLVCRQIMKHPGHVSLWQQFQTFATKWTIIWLSPPPPPTNMSISLFHSYN